MRLEIEHELTLTLPPGTAQTVLHLLLTPGSGPAQTVDSWSVEVAGIGNAGRFADAYGNMVHLVNQSRPEGPITIKASGVVTTRDTHGVIGKPGGEPVPALYKRTTGLTKTPPIALYGKFRNSRDGRLDVLHGLMARVGETLGLRDRAEGQTQMQADGTQEQSQGETGPLPPAADYAHLFIAAARALNIPARFVAGYVAEGDGYGGGMHAWAEAYDEGLGWIGFDPAQQVCSTERHVRLAIGLDAQAAKAVRTVPVGTVEERVVIR